MLVGMSVLVGQIVGVAVGGAWVIFGVCVGVRLLRLVGTTVLVGGSVAVAVASSVGLNGKTVSVGVLVAVGQQQSTLTLQSPHTATGAGQSISRQSPRIRKTSNMSSATVSSFISKSKL